jgi:hypothetical protein
MALPLKPRLAVAAALAAALSFGFLRYLATRPSPGAPPLDGGTTAVLAGATKVEVFRTDGTNGPFDERPRAPGEERIGGFRVTARGQDRGPEFAARLADVLLDGRTYSAARLACYWPGVAFRVWYGEEWVEVLICFHCDNLYCGPATERVPRTASFHSTAARARLVRLAKEAFPDEEVQGLKEGWTPGE